jgi:hypothetical protein
MSSDSVAARSKIVRGTLVTGIPFSTAISSAGKGEWCRRIPFHERLFCGVVTSMIERELGLILQRAAADQ